MCPLQSASVIHPDWSAHHQPVAAGTLTGKCTITIPGSAGGWDPEHGPTPGTPGQTLHTGPFRAQALTAHNQARDAAGQAVTIRNYLVVVEADAPTAPDTDPDEVPDIPTGARITVDECPDDPRLVGKVLTVTGVTYASHRFERDLYADLDLSNQPPGR